MGVPPPNLSGPMQAVLRVLLEDPTEQRYGPDLRALAAVSSGRMHPVLARLENLGWVASDWEDIDPLLAKRPRRRYYGLTPNGLQAGRAALASANSDRPRVAYRQQPAGGVA